MTPHTSFPKIVAWKKSSVLTFTQRYLEAEYLTHFTQETESVLIQSSCKNKMCIQSWLPVSQTGAGPCNFVSSVLFPSQNWAWSCNKTYSNVLSMSSWSKTVQNKQNVIQLWNKNITLKQKMLHSQLVENSEGFFNMFFDSAICYSKNYFKEPFFLIGPQFK